MEETDNSIADWRKELYNSLKCTGRLDTLKSQLRAKLMGQLRDQDGTLLEFKGRRKPTVTERILSSLFLDYLTAYGYSCTLSVFLPESQAVSWPAFTFKEMCQLLHLNPRQPFHRPFNIEDEEKGCLAQQLVMLLQQVPARIGNQDNSTQTRPDGSRDLDCCLREIDESCLQRKIAERQTTFRTVEERLNTFREEFETRVDAEVALQVSRIRDYELNAIRVEEEARYRRKLTRDTEELEQIHKSRLERIREREESLAERLVMKEKAIEASAYEQRQKMLLSITELRNREENLKAKESMQKRMEDTLRGREEILKLKETDVSRRVATMRAEAEESSQLVIKELQVQNRKLQEQFQSERAALEAEWVACKESKSRLESELAAAKIDNELVHSLRERLEVEEKKRAELVAPLLERLSSEEQKRKVLLRKLEDLQHTTNNMDPSAQAASLHTRYNLQGHRFDYSNGNWEEESSEERSMGNGCKVCQQQQQRWAKMQKKFHETIKQLEEALQDAVDGRDRAHQARRSIQKQLKSSDSELLETISLLKKTQYALELERLHHYALRSQIASGFSLSSQDIPERDTDPRRTPRECDACSRNFTRSLAAQKTLGPSSYLQSGLLDFHNGAAEPSPRAFRTKAELMDACPLDDFPLATPAQSHSAPCLHEEERIYAEPSRESGPREGFAPNDDQKMVNCAQSPDADAVKEATNGDNPHLRGGGSPDISVERSLDTERRRCNSSMNSQQEKTARICRSQTLSDSDDPTSAEGSQELSGKLPNSSKRRELPKGNSTPTPAEVVQEISQSRTDYCVMGSQSSRSNGSAVEIKLQGKKVKSSSYTDSQSEEERVKTDVNFFEFKFQKKVHVDWSRDGKGHPNAPGETGHPRAKSENETGINKETLPKSSTSTASRRDCPSTAMAGVGNPASPRDTHSPAGRGELPELSTGEPLVEIKKVNPGDDALHILSCPGNSSACRDECSPDASDAGHRNAHVPNSIQSVVTSDSSNLVTNCKQGFDLEEPWRMKREETVPAQSTSRVAVPSPWTLPLIAIQVPTSTEANSLPRADPTPEDASLGESCSISIRKASLARNHRSPGTSALTAILCEEKWSQGSHDEGVGAGSGVQSDQGSSYSPEVSPTAGSIESELLKDGFAVPYTSSALATSLMMECIR